MLLIAKRKLLVLVFTAIAVVLGSATACLPDPEDRRVGPGDEPTPAPTSAAVSKPTFLVSRGEVVNERELNGRIVPVQDAALAFQVNGVIAEVYAGQNDVVHAGDTIAMLEQSSYLEELSLARAELAIAQQQLESRQAQIAFNRRRAELKIALAQLDLDHARAIGGASPSPQRQYEISRLEILLEMAELELDELDSSIDPSVGTAVDAAARRVREAEAALAKTTLTAPIDGEILSLRLTVGSAVSAHKPIGTIGDTSQLEVSILTGLSGLEELEEGMPAMIHFASRPGEAFSGQIRLLPFPFGSGEAAEENLSMRIGFTDSQAAQYFELGDRVSVQIWISRHAGALWLPPAAVREFNGRWFVIVQDDAVRQRRVDIDVGILSRDRIEILSGVDEGEVVVGP